MSTLGAQESCIFQHITEVLREAFKNQAIFYLTLQKTPLKVVGCSLRNPQQVWALWQVSEVQVQPLYLALAICHLLDGSTALAPWPLLGTALQLWEIVCPPLPPCPAHREVQLPAFIIVGETPGKQAEQVASQRGDRCVTNPG